MNNNKIIRIARSIIRNIKIRTVVARIINGDAVIADNDGNYDNFTGIINYGGIEAEVTSAKFELAKNAVEFKSGGIKITSIPSFTDSTYVFSGNISNGDIKITTDSIEWNSGKFNSGAVWFPGTYRNFNGVLVYNNGSTPVSSANFDIADGIVKWISGKAERDVKFPIEATNFSGKVKLGNLRFNATNADFTARYSSGKAFIWWEGGTWENGTWTNGIWNEGTWKSGKWIFGIWNDNNPQKTKWITGTDENNVVHTEPPCQWEMVPQFTKHTKINKKQNNDEEDEQDHTERYDMMDKVLVKAYDNGKLYKIFMDPRIPYKMKALYYNGVFLVYSIDNTMKNFKNGDYVNGKKVNHILSVIHKGTIDAPEIKKIEGNGGADEYSKFVDFLECRKDPETKQTLEIVPVTSDRPKNFTLPRAIKEIAVANTMAVTYDDSRVKQIKDFSTNSSVYIDILKKEHNRLKSLSDEELNEKIDEMSAMQYIFLLLYIKEKRSDSWQYPTTNQKMIMKKFLVDEHHFFKDKNELYNFSIGNWYQISDIYNAVSKITNGRKFLNETKNCSDIELSNKKGEVANKEADKFIEQLQEKFKTIAKTRGIWECLNKTP